MQENIWWPSSDEYNPQITKEQWVLLLQNKEIFNYNCMCMMKRFLDCSGSATVKILENKYGKSFSAYISYSTTLANKIIKEINCPLPPQDSEHKRVWPILYVGKKAEKEDNISEGNYIWKLREELKEALMEIEILSNPDYPLYEPEKENITCIEANISWNSKNWQGVAGDKTNFGYTKVDGNIPQESWNFDLENERNTIDKLYGFAQFTKAPKNAERNPFLIIFRSQNKIVGFYGNTQVLKNYKKNNFKQDYNLIADKSLVVLLENKIDDSNHTFLFGNKQGRINFNYIKKEESLEIFQEAIKLNPNQSESIKKIANWLNTGSNSGETLMNSKINTYTELLRNTHNLILHGAPGTGKTYLAKQIALNMNCEKKDIGFVQFHPSFDYTDFVEGLRPTNTDANGNIGFIRQDGVFKSFCKSALISKDIDEEAGDFLNKTPTVWKVSLEGTGDNVTRRDCLDNGWIRVGWNSYGDIEDFNDFDEYNEGGKYILRAFQHEMKIGDVILSCYSASEIDAIGIVTGDYEYREEGEYYPRYRTVKWIVKDIRENIVELNKGKKFTLSTIYKLQIPLTKIIEIVHKYKEPSVSNIQKEKDYVFIIDEINRGDLSKIFGELFYSIEAGYRGEDGKVKTQYQNLIEPGDIFYEGFYIPENVYIIGTMNDIDRSVESMDFAFRRRFTFKEIKANDNIEMLSKIEDITIRNKAISKMKSLNDKISQIEGLSSAYHIGGAYFLKLTEINYDFDLLWEYHLEGLLQEYLRGMPNAESKMLELKDTYEQA